MKSKNEIKKEINKLTISAKKHRIFAIQNDTKIRDLKRELSKICDHENTKIVTQSYEEPGKVKYFEWKEKVCKDCGKIVATLKEEITTKWVEHK